MKITALTLSSLRGIPAGWPEIVIGEKGLIVLGPNGVGKSSIIDGLEFCIMGSSTLFSDQRTGVTWKQASSHIRGGKARAEIKLQDNNKSYILSTNVASQAEVAEWQSLARNSRFVLRRHLLLKFIDSTPKDRYTRLEPFLNLHEFLEIEENLENLASLMKTFSVSDRTNLSETDQRLRATFSIDSQTEISSEILLEKLNQQLKKCNFHPLERISDIKSAEELVETALNSYAKDPRITALQTLKGQLQRLTLPGTYLPLLDQLKTAIINLELAEKGRTGTIPTDFLSRAKNFIYDQSLNQCPVCEKDFERDLLLARLETRIFADDHLSTALNVFKTAKRAAIEPIERLSHAMEQFILDWNTAFEVQINDEYTKTADLLNDSIVSLNAKMDSQIVHDLYARFTAALESHAEISEVLDAQITHETGGARRQMLIEASQMISFIEKHWQSYDDFAERARTTQRKFRAVERLHGHAVEARKQAIQLVLNEVADIANKFYEFLHPFEQISGSKLKIRENQDGSVILETNFYGKEAPPLLHYSESHLDTLGLCYFLALRKREATINPKFKVLVLDDVIHSVDSKHRARFALLLKQEFDDHQIVIVTHDEVFYQRLRQVLGSKYRFMTISDWDIERGPFLGDSTTDLDTITREEMHRNLSTRDLAAASGRFFEWLLRSATENIQVAIPARFSRGHDIGSMWPALSAKLRKQRHFITQNPSIIAEIDAHGWVRNIAGAHYNEPASPPEPEEVRLFARGLTKLYNSLHCDECGHFVYKISDNDWRCRCQILKYAQVDSH